MSKNLAGLIQILGAGTVGYMQGKRLEEKEAEAKAERESERAFLNEQRDRDRKVWAEQDDLKQTVKDEMADQTVGNVSSYDISSMDGGDPAQQPVVGYQAGKAGEVFGDRGTAQQAMLGVNSQAAKYQRTAKALAVKGHTDAARQHEAFAKTAINEGTDQILGAISATAPKVEDVKKAGGMVAGTIGAQAAEIFNKTGGKWSVSADTVIQHFVDKDAAGREFVNSRVLGKDGKPVVEDVRAAGMMLADFKTRLAQQNQDTQTYQTAQQQAEAARHNKVGEQQTAEEHRSLRADRAATRSIQQQRLALEHQQFKRLSPAGQIAEIEQITGKLSDADKKQVGLSMLGVKGKSGDDGAKATNDLVDKLVEKFADVNPDPAAVAQHRAALRAKFGSLEKNNSTVESMLREQLAIHQPDTPQYAAKYAEAKTIEVADPKAKDGKRLISNAELTAMGYPPPKSASARMAAKVGAASAAPAPARTPAAPFRGTPRTGEASRAQAAQEAAQAQAQEKASQRATLARNITQIEKTLAAGTGNAQFQQTAKARLDRYKAELSALEGVAGQ